MSVADDGAMQAVILVGGRGTRLGAVTDVCPKPLVDVGGRPFLDYLIAELVRHGFTDILLLAGYLADQLKALEARAAGLGCRIRCLVEPSPAGTGGALMQARDHLAEQFLLLNDDSLFAINYLDLCLPPAGLADAVGAVALRRMADTGRYGRVELSGAAITDFAEKGAGGAGLINGGIYWLRRSVLDWIDTVPASLEQDVLPRLARAGRLTGKSYDGFFIESACLTITCAHKRSFQLRCAVPPCFSTATACSMSIAPIRIAPSISNGPRARIRR